MDTDWGFTLQALALDCMYLKAWQRRASARNSLGDILGCLQDLDSALRLAPDSTAISQEMRQSLVNFLTSQGLRTPMAKRSMTVHMLEAAPQQAAAAAKPEFVIQGDGSRSQEHAEVATCVQQQQHQHRLGTHGTASSASGVHIDIFSSHTIASETSQQGQTSALAAVFSPVPKAHTAPTTSTDFERDWRGFKGCHQLQVQYLRLVEPSTLPNVFGSAITPGLLAQIVSAALTSVLDSTFVDHSIAILQNSANLDRFLMNWMLVSKAATAEIADKLRKCLTCETLELWRSDLLEIQQKFRL